MRKLLAACCFALLGSLAGLPSYAQSISPVILPGGCGTGAAGAGSLAYLTVDSTLKLCTAASVSASITGFPTVQSTGTPISVTTGGVTGTLPAGTVVVASNVGATNGAYCKLGASATTSDQLIPPNSWFSFTVGANTQLTCITSTSTTTVNMVGGSGLPTGSGGGGGGSGGGAVTIAAGADVTTGNTTDGACAGDATSGCTVESRLIRIAQNLTTVNGTAAGAVAAGTNRIGYTSDDPCNNASTKVYTPINVVTATNVIIAGVSAKKKFICSIFLYPAGTDNVAIYQATTGTSCATALVAILGGTTTTTGFQMTAQAGFVVGNGVSSVAATTVVNTDICVTTSAAVQLSGVVVTADQ